MYLKFGLRHLLGSAVVDIPNTAYFSREGERRKGKGLNV